MYHGIKKDEINGYLNLVCKMIPKRDKPQIIFGSILPHEELVINEIELVIQENYQKNNNKKMLEECVLSGEGVTAIDEGEIDAKPMCFWKELKIVLWHYKDIKKYFKTINHHNNKVYEKMLC